MLEEVNRINLLYDIYSPLLTERQQEVLQFYFSDNYSLAEIADEYGTSRQAVHDIIQRALAAIERFEEKLGLYKLLKDQQNLLSEADSILSEEIVGCNEKKRLRELVEQLRFNLEM